MIGLNQLFYGGGADFALRMIECRCYCDLPDFKSSKSFKNLVNISGKLEAKISLCLGVLVQYLQTINPLEAISL